jgi:hypothetical protein
MYVPYAAASGRRSEPEEVDVSGSLVFLSQSALRLEAETEVSIMRNESDSVAHSTWDLRPSRRCRSSRWASERHGSIRYRVDLRRHDSFRHELARAATHDHGVGGKRLMGVTPRSAAAERGDFKRQCRTDWSRQWTGRQRGRSGPSGTSAGLTTVGSRAAGYGFKRRGRRLLPNPAPHYLYLANRAWLGLRVLPGVLALLFISIPLPSEVWLLEGAHHMIRAVSRLWARDT